MVQTILFDFDGVILDSMPVREYGFRKIFELYDEVLVEKLLEYHTRNGGLSRYVKIRYFFENLLQESVSERKVLDMANEFSQIMKQELIKKKYLIEESVSFIKKNNLKYNFHIVSGSDEHELQFLCKELELAQYFISIHGSPVDKNTLVKNLLEEYGYAKTETILIGDSQNDFQAAKANGITFYGYNNCDLRDKEKYIESFLAFKL